MILLAPLRAASAFDIPTHTRAALIDRATY
jgi:hypothetical protein